ncbi:ABC transporter permease [Suicoccus acidiformans]|uniref:Cell division protein FtsX n=1 Tax=Suicoccus acidiformans TaxID=2036206 RepID=A0A347WNB6_9LACT|nr:permease-like cell division protein FtsX [Suicoccus acidiformans]AXY26573.1 ABC transporter permease [Suicoccus acidiformans]
MRIIRTFFRHIRDGFRNLFRNGWMTTASILSMSIALIVIGGLALVMLNVQNITTDIEEGVQIRAHIDVAASAEDEQVLGDSIRSLEHVTDVVYRTKEEELASLVAEVGEEFELLAGDANPLYNVYIVDVDDMAYLEEVQAAISQMPYAVEVTYGELDTENLLRMIEIVRVVLALLAAIMVVIAVLLVTNTIRMTINARQDEIEIMRLVGAQNSYIRAPFIYEGIFIGAISALIASLLLYAIYQGLQQATFEIVGVQILQLAPIYPNILYIGLGLLVLGCLLGIIGARRSIRRFLRI